MLRALAISSAVLGAPGLAQQADPNAAFANEVVVAELPGRSIAALVTHRPGATKFTHGLALFPGAPGTINLRVEDGEIRFGLRGNFLIRARRHFLEEGFLTAVIDAPSDQQVNFWHSFRESDRYGEDVRAVLAAVSGKFGVSDWTLIGTSEGSVSAVHAARMAAPPAKRVVLTASLVSPSFQGVGVRLADVQRVAIPLLWVHHADDPCPYTRYSRVRQYAAATKTPLLTVTGERNVRGPPCEAFTQHGFAGAEIRTIRAILSWIRTGAVPLDVAP